MTIPDDLSNLLPKRPYLARNLLSKLSLSNLELDEMKYLFKARSCRIKC
jgi:hypothetical protein